MASATFSITTTDGPLTLFTYISTDNLPLRRTLLKLFPPPKESEVYRSDERHDAYGYHAQMSMVDVRAYIQKKVSEDVTITQVINSIQFLDGDGVCLVIAWPIGHPNH